MKHRPRLLWSHWLLFGLITAIVALSALLVLRALGAPAAIDPLVMLPTAQVLLGNPAQAAVADPLPLRIATPTPGPVPTAAPALPPPAPAVDSPPPTLFPTVPPAPPPAELPAGQATLPPILMYHYVREVDPNADPLGYNLSVTPADFEQQMAWLAQQGYVGVTMATAERCMRGAGGCPARAVALTFDDGYADAYDVVLPILQRYGMRATFYIVSGVVGHGGYMSWEQLAALRDAGMEIGAHTVSHLDLTTLDPGGASFEIAQSKAEIEQRLGIPVASFCYPAGFYNAAIIDLVRASGFSNATTTRWDADYADLFALPRRRVAGGTALDSFAAIVAGG